VVGLQVDTDARRQLRCIADAGRGTYDDADDAASLTVSLDWSSTRAARPFGFEGTAVEGTAEVDEDTPTIGTGSWVDELGGSGSPSDHRTYLVERTIPGSTLHVSATILGSSDGSEAITVSADAAAGRGRGEQCDDEQYVRSGVWTALASTGVTVGPYTTFDQPEPCLDGDRVVLTVRRGNLDGGFGGDTTVPLALHVVEEPPVEGVDGLPDEADDPDDEPPRVRLGGPEVVGGTSFDDAPTLEPGNYSVAGETQLFLVDVGWGQPPLAGVLFPQLDDDAEREGNVHLTIYGPTRREAGALFQDDQTLLHTDAAELGQSSYPVRYLNREGVGDKPGAALPGTYAVAVSMVPDADASGTPVDYGLNLTVAGDVEGEPAYTEDVPELATATTEPSVPTPTPSSTVDDPGAGNDGTGSDDGPGSDTAPTAAGTDDGGDGPSTLLVAGLAGGGLLLLGGGTAAFLASRRA